MLRLFVTGLSLATLGFGSAATANQDLAPAAATQGSVAWVYSVPPPRPEPERRLGQAPSSVRDESLRKTVARLRSDAQSVVDGYQRAMEDCRFESTLHFDDPDQSTLVGNDQPCRSRYYTLIRTEQRRLANRIRELRGDRADLSLHPQASP